MKILIVGAGRIGSSVAESLVSEANDITVVDQDAERIGSLQSRFDLRGVVGNATSPQVLTDAGAADTDMLIAVTSSDETNLVVTMLCARIFNIPTRIARVRNNELRDYPRILGEEGFEATSIIWPEQALVSYLIKLIDFPEAIQVQEFGEGLASLIAVRAKSGSPLVGRPIRELFTHLPQVPARIVAIFRRNRRLEVNASTIVEAGDEVICLCDTRHARRVMAELRHRERPVHSIMIAGKPSFTLNLARMLKTGENRPGGNFDIRILENDRNVVKRLSRELGDAAMLIEGDSLVPLNLNEFMETVLQLYHDAGHAISFVPGEGLPEIDADPAQLRQVFHNLISNSLEAVTEGELVRISIRTEALESQYHAGAIGAVKLSIEDNGPGFTDKILNAAFDPYVTTKPTGTGLGLPIVKKILDDHGAAIKLKNRSNEETGEILGASVEIVFKVSRLEHNPISN